MRVGNIQTILNAISKRMVLKYNSAPGDEEILKNTVDFISFSYYMSVANRPQSGKTIRIGKGNILGGVENPYLEKSEWGWAN